MTKEEMQAEVDAGALELWALELLTQDSSQAIQALIAGLHARAATLVEAAGLNLPVQVTNRSGGSK